MVEMICPEIKMNRVAAALAFIIGAMAVFAGGQVLLGTDPGYHVINWLPVYNYTIGILSVLVTAVLIWIKHRLAAPLAMATLAMHALVMLVLQSAYRHAVAADSIVAMTIRIATWTVILVLLQIQARQARSVTHSI